MRIDPRTTRIRAAIKAAAVRLGISAGTFRAVTVVSYIRFRVALGEFFKVQPLSDSARVSEGENYFAEDYVEPGYVAVPFYINFSKVLSDLAVSADAAALSLSRATSDTASLTDAVALAPRLGIIDQAAASDSGSLRMQDYCDFTYFAEDYVGESRVFT